MKFVKLMLSIMLGFSLALMMVGQVSAELVTEQADGIYSDEFTTLTINGEIVGVPDSLSIREGLIPLRWMAQTMGASNISWDKGIVTVEIDSFLETHRYLGYLNGLEIKNETVYPLPNRLEGLELSHSVGIHSNHTIINPKALTLDIVSQGVSMPYALYDYKIIEDRIFVGANWLNTLFLADVKYDDEKNILSISYMKPAEISSKIGELEKTITPISADEAIALWIRGQQTRSGTLQYSALSNELKEKAITKISNQLWVTGGSSPSLGEAIVVEMKKTDDHVISYKIKYNEMLQGKEWDEIKQKIIVEKQAGLVEDKWVITKIENNSPFYSVLPGESYK